MMAKKPINPAKVAYVPDPCAAVKLELRTAAGIAGQILAHFGAGYGAQREIDAPGTNAQIFDSPTTADTFTSLLMTSILKHYPQLHWDTDVVGRDGICRNAFKHGQLAYKRSMGAPLSWAVLYSTLQEIKNTICISGGGGGIACDF